MIQANKMDRYLKQKHTRLKIISRRENISYGKCQSDKKKLNLNK